MPDLTLRDVEVTYRVMPPVHALRGVSGVIHQGEFVAIEGPSGGGKSTLLNVLGLLHAPTSGAYLVDGADTASMTPAQHARLRAEQFAFVFVFQSFHLLDKRPVADSVELGLLYRGVPAQERHRRAAEALRVVGLGDRGAQPAGTLSGGQRQRVAIARALASRAPVLLADEPTGNLDSASGRSVVEALEAVHSAGVTVVLVTHDPTIASVAQRRWHVRDGRRVDADDHAFGATASPQAAPSSRLQARLRTSDVMRDALANVASQRRRSVGLILSLAVAAALSVATFGLSASASSQVASTFDAHENRFVTAEIQPDTQDAPQIGGWRRPTIAEQRRTVSDLSGVESVVSLQNLDVTPVASAVDRHVGQAPLYRADGDVGALEASIHRAPGASGRVDRPPADGAVLVGTHVAANIQLGPLDADPVILIDGIPHQVAGIIEDGGRLPELTGAMLVGPGDPTSAYASRTVFVVRTRVGAAQQVASQIAVAVRPDAPAAVDVTAPRDPRTLRGSVEFELRTAFLLLTGVMVLTSVISLTNAMVSAVGERRREFGLRRALGAQRRHVTALVMTESGLIAAGGSLCGVGIGLGAVLAVTLARHWAPVLDPSVPAWTLLGGVAVGLVGGSAAAWRAVRIEPDMALRE